MITYLGGKYEKDKHNPGKIKVIISCLLTLSVLFAACSLSGSFVASALIPEESAVSWELTATELIEIGSNQATIEDFVKPVFGDRQIRSCEYIYNLDNSADYIYVEFEAGGYVVYAKETMEMMEYSPQKRVCDKTNDPHKYCRRQQK